MPTVSSADMLLFAAVVRHGGFTRAAQELGVSKQTVSERIGKLEAHLGVRLLERTTRRLRVTDAGGLYAERCAAIAAQIDEANAEILERRAEPMGVLRVSTPVLYGRRFLSPVIVETRLRHPKLRLHVVLADRRVDLVEEGFDLALRIGTLDDSSLTVRKLGEGHVYVVASPRLLAGRRAPTVDTVHELPAIGMRTSETWRIRGVERKLEPALVVNDLEIVCEAAIAGLGIALLPSLVCKDAVLDGRLEVLFGPEPALTSPVYAVFPSRQYVPLPVRAFLDVLAERITPMAPLAVPRRRAARP